MIRKMIATGGVLLVTALAVPAGAQSYPPSDGDLTTSAVEAPKGDTVTIHGTGYAPFTIVTITVYDQDEFKVVTLGTVTTDAEGSFSFTARVPSTIKAGDAVLVAQGLASDGVSTRTLSADVTVAAATTGGGDDSGTGTLPRTGSNDDQLVRFGALSVLAGAGLVVVARRRRGAAAPVEA